MYHLVIYRNTIHATGAVPVLEKSALICVHLRINLSSMGHSLWSLLRICEAPLPLVEWKNADFSG